jgi:hypothetical protein
VSVRRRHGQTGRGTAPAPAPGSTGRLVAVAVLAFLLFTYPFVAVFDVPARVLGLPVLWAYLLTAWAAVIALVAWLSRRS